MTDDVICLESRMEQDYSYFLSEMIEDARVNGTEEEIALIRSFWGNENSWEEIQERAAVEGSTWYVWWMDGVRAYLRYETAKEHSEGT